MDANHTQSDKSAGKGSQSVVRHDPGTPQASMEPSRGTAASDVPGRGSPTDSALEPRSGDRTTQPTPSTQSVPTVPSPLAQMHALVQRAGEEPFSDKIAAVLSEPIDDHLVDIRPDGLIYVTHSAYRTRLDRAFGVGGWSLVPLAPPKIDGTKVYYYGFLKAAGRFVADAIGEADFISSNRRDSYGQAVEKAKSDCLVRCCKLLPIFRECWDKEYCDYWKSKYATGDVDRQGNIVSGWRKKPEYKRQFKQPEAKPYEAKPLRITRNDEYNDNTPEYDRDEAERQAWEIERD